MKYISSIFLIVFAAGLAAQQNWVLKRNEQGIKIYTSPATEGGRMQHIKAEITFQSSAHTIAQTLMNVNELHKWVYKCSSSQLIAKQGDSVVIYRHVTDVPWPFEDRDQVAKFTIHKDAKTGIIAITSKLVAGYPKYPGYVRIHRSEASWKLVPNKDKVDALYELAIDPGGTVPSWIMNLFITDGPFRTFVNLKKMLGES